MNHGNGIKLGIVFLPEHPPEALPGFARRAEQAGFDELWLWEDCFWAGGIASAAVALASTERIAVGLGIMPAVVRNPVFAAMEIAALARLYPGRFLPGLGHGVAGWLRQIGDLPSSRLVSLEEITVAVRRLLAGEKFSYDGSFVQLSDAELVHPPQTVPPLSLGVRGPKSLALSGRVADGTILAGPAAPAYVSWAKEQIEKGRQQAGREEPHRLTVYNLACAGETTAAARNEIRPTISAILAYEQLDAQLRPLDFFPQIQELKANGGMARIQQEMPDAWIDLLSIAGTPADWQAAIGRLVTAGAHSVVLVPQRGKGVDEVEVFAGHL